MSTAAVSFHELNMRTEQRRQEIQDASAAMYARLRAQYEGAHGEVTPAADELLQKIAYLEKLAMQAKDELDSDGLRESYAVSNYRSASRENKALGMLLKIEAQQSKLLKDLKLLPGGRQAKDEPDDDPDEDIDNY